MKNQLILLFAFCIVSVCHSSFPLFSNNDDVIHNYKNDSVKSNNQNQEYIVYFDDPKITKINKNNEDYIKINRVWIKIFIGIMIFSLLIGLLLVRWTNKHYSGGTPLG
tara:strand:+ start:227 stop:550 length:324 start_codon:yes stop_codon:yes gene_type:complete